VSEERGREKDERLERRERRRTHEQSWPGRDKRRVKKGGDVSLPAQTFAVAREEGQKKERRKGKEVDLFSPARPESEGWKQSFEPKRRRPGGRKEWQRWRAW